MGSFVSKAMEQNIKKNQEFMLEMNRITVSGQAALNPVVSFPHI